MTLRRQPSLGYRAFDVVLLTLVALWASKRPQVLAPHARLDNCQPHGRATSGTQWPLVLFIEHKLPPMFDARRSSGPTLNRRSQLGRHPFHRVGRGDDFIDMMAIDALEHAPFESETRWLDVCEYHRACTLGTGMGRNC